MHDFQTINEIVSESVRNSSYYTVAISSCVFILYDLINNLVSYFKTKSKNKPLIEISKVMVEMTENIVKLNAILDKTFKDAEIKEANRITNIIVASFNSFKSEIITRAIDIIVHNNIEANKESVKQSIYRTVSTEYYKVYSIFSAYEHDKVNVATKLKEEWIDTVTEEVFQIIYNSQDATDRIRQINNKLSIDTEEYSTYINNKIFNH